MGSSTEVIDPRFCFPGNFRVINDKGDIMFNVKERLLSFHSRHVLLDAAGNTIATLKKKAQREHRFRRVMKGRDTLSVTMSPNVNYSFVVGLMVMLDRINDGMDD